MKTTYLLLFLLVSLLGCASGRISPPSCSNSTAANPSTWPKVNRVLYLDQEMDSVETAVVMAGAMAWTEATRGIVQWKIRYGVDKSLFEYKGPPCSDSLIVVKAPSTAAVIQKLDEASGAAPDRLALAYTKTSCNLNITLMIFDRIEDDDLSLVATHEIGHFLGIGHLAKPNLSIMTPSTGEAAPCIMKADLEAFCALYRCDASLLLACPYKPEKAK